MSTHGTSVSTRAEEIFADYLVRRSQGESASTRSLFQNHPHIDRELRRYFKGELRNFETPLVAPGTDFQQQVWAALQDIPYGTTCSYEDIAKAIGNPKAVRAVGRANGDNRLLIIIPCHRVVRADGSLGGYGGELWRKQFLLELEGAEAAETAARRLPLR